MRQHHQHVIQANKSITIQYSALTVPTQHTHIIRADTYTTIPEVQKTVDCQFGRDSKSGYYFETLF